MRFVLTILPDVQINYQMRMPMMEIHRMQSVLPPRAGYGIASCSKTASLRP